VRTDISSCPDDLVEPLPPIDTGTHGLVLLPEMEPCVRALERALAGAKRRIHIECYIVKGDAFGLWLEKMLIPAVRRGVDVKLLYDALGSEESDPKYFEDLKAHGIDARIYRDTHAMLKGGSGPFPRDHGRVIVIDDSAFTGGLAIRDDWFPKRRGGKGWHDVSLQILWGPVVEDFEKVFQTRWQEGIGEHTPCDIETGDRYPDLELVADCPAHSTLVYDHHRRAIRRAKHRIWFENCYFFPPPAMLQEIADAAKRGVDVKVILPKESDLPLIEQAARSEYPEWVKHGLRIFEYGRCMNHSKMTVIDDDFATVGTFNANATSMAMANEVNVFVKDKKFVALCAEHFCRDLEFCDEVDIAEVLKRPLLHQVRDRLKADALNIVDLVAGPHDRGRDIEKNKHPAAKRESEQQDARESEPCRPSQS
jgi:cardiolipin synthase A/B